MLTAMASILQGPHPDPPPASPGEGVVYASPSPAARRGRVGVGACRRATVESLWFRS
jgi:hypothetical protein